MKLVLLENFIILCIHNDLSDFCMIESWFWQRLSKTNDNLKVYQTFFRFSGKCIIFKDFLVIRDPPQRSSSIFLHLYVDEGSFSQIKQGRIWFSPQNGASFNVLLIPNYSEMKSEFQHGEMASCYRHPLKIWRDLGQ